MTDGKPSLSWPGADDTVVVEEMLRDPISGQWYECREFVKKRVQIQAKNIPRDAWDDIVQDAMMRVNKSLPTFQYQCTLRTWLFGIIRSSIIDAYRKLTRPGPPLIPLGDPHDDAEHETSILTASMQSTVEDECIMREELQKAVAALQEYAATHANPARNRRILDMVIMEGRSLEAAAEAVGCSAPVVGYVVHSAQRYAREKLKDQR